MLLNPFIGTTGVGTGGGVSYFFEERFEGTGYDNSNANGWTAAGTGTVDPDYTGTILEGSQSLRIAASAQQPRTAIAAFDSDASEIWGFFRFRINTLPSALRGFVHLRNSIDATIWTIQFTGTNAIGLKHGTNSSSGTATIPSTGVDYYVWFHFNHSTGGNNGTASVGYSATSTEVTGGATYVAMSNGTSTDDIHSVIVGFSGSNTTAEFIFDHFLISTTGTIGNNPA